MRVLHVASGDLWAGAEVQLATLLAELRRRGDVELAAVFLNEGELERRVRALGIPVQVFDEARLSAGALASRLRGHVALVRPDVVHSHRVKENVLAACATLGRPRVALVRSVHGAPETATSLRSRVQFGLERGLWALKRGHTVAVSRHLHAAFASAGVPRLEFIANGIDPDATRAAAADGPRGPVLAGRTRIAFAGRLVPVKRVDLFLRAAAAIAATDAGDTHFYVIGEGPLAAELKAQAHGLGLEDRVTFTGFVANCLPLLAQMHALALTSDHEGTPMVALEALALGVPVVARAVGGLPDVVRSAEQGVLVDGASADAIAAAMLQAAAAPRPATLPSDFTLAASAARYADLYRSLTAATRLPDRAGAVR